MKMTISFSDTEWAILRDAASAHKTSPTNIAKEVLSVWFADRRAERRYQAEPSHYEARNGSDFEEVAG